MKKIEALKRARDALLAAPTAYRAPETIAFIDEALAEQPAQQQEPVAYMGTDIEGNPNKFRLNPFGGCIPLYEKPQSVKVWDAEGYDALCQELEGWKAKASKPWAGLTDEEIGAVDWKANETLHDFARAIEAKLKERNA